MEPLAGVDGNVSGRALRKAVVRRRRRARWLLSGGAQGVAEEFLDDDEFDGVLQEDGRCRVSEIVEADAAEPGPAEQGVEVSGEGGSLDRGAVGPSGDVATVLPVRTRSLTFPGLPAAVLFEGAQARRGQGDEPL